MTCSGLNQNILELYLFSVVCFGLSSVNVVDLIEKGSTFVLKRRLINVGTCYFKRNEKAWKIFP